MSQRQLQTKQNKKSLSLKASSLKKAQSAGLCGKLFPNT
jgi:hypothetical protein